jgi:hypothetical protein
LEVFNNVLFLYGLAARPVFAVAPDMKGSCCCVEMVVVDSREWVAFCLGVEQYQVTFHFIKIAN